MRITAVLESLVQNNQANQANPPQGQPREFATYMLVGDAENRWEHTRQLLEAEHGGITWEMFKDSFLEKYFPDERPKCVKFENGLRPETKLAFG